jgi:hypothetical protein
VLGVRRRLHRHPIRSKGSKTWSTGPRLSSINAGERPSNPHGEKDANGKMFHDEVLKTVQTKGAGWVDYMFPKPGQTQPSHKWSYVKGFKTDGMASVIGAGFFRDRRRLLYRLRSLVRAPAGLQFARSSSANVWCWHAPDDQGGKASSALPL